MIVATEGLLEVQVTLLPRNGYVFVIPRHRRPRDAGANTQCVGRVIDKNPCDVRVRLTEIAARRDSHGQRNDGAQRMNDDPTMAASGVRHLQGRGGVRRLQAHRAASQAMGTGACCCRCG